MDFFNKKNGDCPGDSDHFKTRGFYEHACACVFHSKNVGAFPLLTSEASIIKMSVGESLGRKAVLQCTSDLTSLLKHNLSCSGKLLEKGLITEAVHDYVLTAQGVSTQEKAARLVSCLADRVGASSQGLHHIIEVLKETDPFCGDIVDKLTETFHSALIGNKHSY